MKRSQKEGEIYTTRMVVICFALICFFLVDYLFMQLLDVFTWYGISVNTERETGKKLIAFLCVTILHEVLHYIAYWRICGIDRKHIFFGFHWRWFVTYCGCRVPVSVDEHRKVLILPIVVTGCMAFVMLLIVPAEWTVIVLAFTLAIGTMDVIHFCKMRKFEGNCIVTGHPTEFGGDMIFKDMEAARLFFEVNDPLAKEDL